jgi:hypothetical protein
VPNPLTDDEEPVDIPLPVLREIPFRWKGVDTLLNGITQEQMQRQLITVHRMVTNRQGRQRTKCSMSIPIYRVRHKF